MSDALSRQTPKKTFTREELSPAARSLLYRMQAVMADFDARPPQYKPRHRITAVGVALLIQRDIQAMDAAWYGYSTNATFPNANDGGAA